MFSSTRALWVKRACRMFLEPAVVPRLFREKLGSVNLLWAHGGEGKRPRMIDTYLSEAFYGDYKFGSEDRLSQIFSASFNHSPLFRRAVNNFFGCKRLSQSRSKTQQQYSDGKEPARPDILFHNQNGTLLGAVENKIEADFSPNQLTKYSRIPELIRCRKFCLVKHYKSVSDIHNGWCIRYWRALYIHLVSLPKAKIDFVTENFIATLKEYGMESPVVIKRVDLKRLAEALHSIRSDDKPLFSYNGPIFETLVDLKKFLEDVFRQAAKNPVLAKRAGKAFRPKMWVGHWWAGEKLKGKQLLWIGCEVDTRRPHKGLKGFGAALTLHEKADVYDLAAYVTKMDGDYGDKEMTYPRTDVVCSDFAERAIKYWARVWK